MTTYKSIKIIFFTWLIGMMLCTLRAYYFLDTGGFSYYNFYLVIFSWISPYFITVSATLTSLIIKNKITKLKNQLVNKKVFQMSLALTIMFLFVVLFIIEVVSRGETTFEDAQIFANLITSIIIGLSIISINNTAK